MTFKDFLQNLKSVLIGLGLLAYIVSGIALMAGFMMFYENHSLYWLFLHIPLLILWLCFYIPTIVYMKVQTYKNINGIK